MKRFRLKARFLAAILLVLGLSMLIFLNIMSRKNIGHINESFTSIYNDRLIHATDIFYIMENLYNKRLTMEKYLLSKENQGGLSYNDLIMYDKSIDSLLMLYEKTYLVDNEFKCLSNFKLAMANYSSVENKILSKINSGNKIEAIQIFESEGSETFSLLIKDLHDLTYIQSSVGEELIKKSQIMLSDVKISSRLEIVVVILIIIGIQLIIFTTKRLNFPYQKLNLN